MNTVIFDKSDPEIAKALMGCKVGEEKEITIKIMPTVDDDAKLVADITEIVSGYEEEEAEGEEVPVVEGQEDDEPEMGLVASPFKKKDL